MQQTKTKFAIFGNSFQIEKSSSLSQVLQSLKHHAVTIAIEKTFYEFIRKNIPFTFEPDEIITTNDFTADFAISLGGDGTFLKCAEAIKNKNIPIIGINTGHLGFLADTTPDEIDTMLNNITRGEYTIEKRSVLKVISPKKRLSVYPYALNEVALLKHDNSSMISIKVSVDNTYLSTYQSDGIIICTPTGSTGYSLSVGGPIISPSSRILAINAVAPHSLNMRPVVLNDDCTISLEVSSRNHNFLLSIDGRSQSLPEGTPLTIRKAPYSIFVVRNKHYFDTLRTKLMWGADKRI